jgi:RNA polymerase sigma-70 factor (ECF subfamily)
LTAIRAPDSLFLPIRMPPPDIPDRKSVSNSKDDTSPKIPAPEDVQLSPPHGVSTDVSSVAVDRGLLGGGFLGGNRSGRDLSDRGLSDRSLPDRGLPNLPAAADPASGSSSAEAVSDADVMLRVKAGDEAAFSYLVQKYRRPMVGFMFRFCHNPSAAEELAQEVFLRVYRSRTTYEASAKFTTWLYRIATNLAVNYARDTRHERPENTVRLDEPDQETGTTPDLADDALSAEEQLLKRERLAAIRSKVNALPERQRVAVVMHKYQQMDYREIAAVLKLSESATKSLLFRAYETLREQLKEFI